MIILDFSSAAQARTDMKYYEAVFDIVSERLTLSLNNYTTADSHGDRKGRFQAFSQMFVYHGCLLELYPLQPADKPLNCAARIMFMETDTLSAVMDVRNSISGLSLAQTKRNAHGSAEAVWTDILEYCKTRVGDEEACRDFFPNDYQEMQGIIERELTITLAQLAYLTPDFIESLKKPPFDPGILVQSDLPDALPDLDPYEGSHLRPV